MRCTRVQPARLKSKPDGHRASGLIALLILVALVLTLIPTGAVLADSPLVVGATQDTFLREISKNMGNGGQPYVSVHDRSSRHERSILQFSITDIPAGSTITDAELSLYYDRYFDTNPSGKSVMAYKLTRTDWVEGTGKSQTPSPDGATWNHYDCTGTKKAWTTAGGDYVTSSPSGASATMPASAGSRVTWNVTAIVADAYSGGITVNILLRFENEGQASGYSQPEFRSKEESDSALRPILTVTYTEPPAEPPTVGTSSATDVSYTTATANGAILDIGTAAVTTRGFEWGTDSGGPYPNDWHEDGDFSAENFSRGLTGLDDDTTYYYRAYAENSVGTGHGPELSFTTLAYVAPTVVTHNATGISYTIATLNGEITAIGGINATTRGFEWGTSTGVYTWSWNQTGSYGTGTFDRDLTGLDADQEYYFRAFAINDGGTGYGAELSFRTLLPCPGAPTDLTVTQTGVNQVTVSWVKGTHAADTIVVMHEDSHPTAHTADYEVYSSNGTSVVLDGLSLTMGTYYFSAWSENACGVSTSYATAQIGGEHMIFMLLGLLALGLTVAMFATRNMLLGFPSGIFWGILGGYAYVLSTKSWDDWRYLLFFAAMGMLIFSILAAFSLRRRDLDGPEEPGPYFDEGGGGPRRPRPSPRRTPSVATRAPQPDQGGSWGDIDSLGMHDREDRRPQPNYRRAALHERARRRRGGEAGH